MFHQKTHHRPRCLKSQPQPPTTGTKLIFNRKFNTNTQHHHQHHHQHQRQQRPTAFHKPQQFHVKSTHLTITPLSMQFMKQFQNKLYINNLRQFATSTSKSPKTTKAKSTKSTTTPSVSKKVLKPNESTIQIKSDLTSPVQPQQQKKTTTTKSTSSPKSTPVLTKSTPNKPKAVIQAKIPSPVITKVPTKKGQSAKVDVEEEKEEEEQEEQEEEEEQEESTSTKSTKSKSTTKSTTKSTSTPTKSTTTTKSTKSTSTSTTYNSKRKQQDEYKQLNSSIFIRDSSDDGLIPDILHNKIRFYRHRKEFSGLDTNTKAQILLLLTNQVDPNISPLFTQLFDDITTTQSHNQNMKSSNQSTIISQLLTHFTTFHSQLFKHQYRQDGIIDNNVELLYSMVPRLGRPPTGSLVRSNQRLRFDTDITRKFLQDLITLILFTVQFRYDDDGNPMQFTTIEKEQIQQAFQFHFLENILSGEILTIDECIQTVIRILAEAGTGKSEFLLCIIPILIMICNFFGKSFVITLDSHATSDPIQIRFIPSTTPTSDDYYFEIYQLGETKHQQSQPEVSLERVAEYIPSNSIHIYEGRDFHRINNKNQDGKLICEVFEDLSNRFDSVISNLRTLDPNYNFTTIMVSSTPHMYQIYPEIVKSKARPNKVGTKDSDHILDLQQYLAKQKTQHPPPIKSTLSPPQASTTTTTTTSSSSSPPPRPQKTALPQQRHLPLVLSKQHYSYLQVMNIMVKELLFTTKELLLLSSNVTDDEHTTEINTFLTTINQINIKYLFPTFYQNVIQFSKHRQNNHFIRTTNSPSPKLSKSSNIRFNNQFIAPALVYLPHDSTLPFEDKSNINTVIKLKSNHSQLPIQLNNEIIQIQSKPVQQEQSSEDLNHNLSETSSQDSDEDENNNNSIYIHQPFIQEQLFQLFTTTPTLRNAERILESFARNNVNNDTAQLLLQHIIHLSPEQVRSFRVYMTQQYQLHLQQQFDPIDDTNNDIINNNNQHAQNELELASQYDAVMKLSSFLLTLISDIASDLTNDIIKILNNTSNITQSTQQKQAQHVPFNDWQTTFSIESPRISNLPLRLLINNIYFQQFLFPNSVTLNTTSNNVQQEQQLFENFSKKCANLFTPIPRYTAVRSISQPNNQISTLPTTNNIKLALHPQQIINTPPKHIRQEISSINIVIQSLFHILHDAVDFYHDLNFVLPLPKSHETRLNTTTSTTTKSNRTTTTTTTKPIPSKEYFQGKLKLVLKIDDGNDQKIYRNNVGQYIPFESKPEPTFDVDDKNEQQPQKPTKSFQFLRCPQQQVEADSHQRSNQLSFARKIIEELDNGELALILTPHGFPSVDLIAFFRDNDETYCTLGEIRDCESPEPIQLPTSASILNFFHNTLNGQFDDFFNTKQINITNDSDVREILMNSPLGFTEVEAQQFSFNDFKDEKQKATHHISKIENVLFSRQGKESVQKTRLTETNKLFSCDIDIGQVLEEKQFTGFVADSFFLFTLRSTPTTANNNNNNITTKNVQPDQIFAHTQHLTTNSPSISSQSYKQPSILSITTLNGISHLETSYLLGTGVIH